MKKNDIAVFAVIAILIAGGVIYSRYSMQSEAANSIKVLESKTINKDTGDTSIETGNTMILTYQGEGIKNVSNTFFDDMTKWENVVTGLSVPWEIAFRQDGKMYITERVGNILLYDNTTKQKTVWSHIDVAQGQGYEKGLLGLAVDPYNDEIVYIAYTYQNGDSDTNTLVKIDRSSGKEKVTKLIDGVAGSKYHDGGRVAFGPDNKLYWTMGDAENSAYAQDSTSLNGKILRLNPDGSIPADNPIKDSYIRSEGHRNPQGLAWQPKTNYLRSSEHGPSRIGDCCRDELNIILPGKNYGRPIIRGSQQKENLQQPIWISSESDTWAPGGMTFITEKSRKNNLLIAGLKGESVYRVIFDEKSPTKIIAVERHIYKEFGRLRNVVQYDGYIYVLTSNKDGRQKGTIGAQDDRIVRIKIE